MDIFEQREQLNKETELDPKLEQKVSDNLALIPNDGNYEEVEESEIKEDEGNIVENNSDDDNNDSPDSLDTGDNKENNKDEIVLPENYRRAAIHQGWTEDEVTDFFKSNPEQAVKTFEKIYNSTNYITEQTAALGRIAQAEQKRKTDEELKTAQSKPKFRDAIEVLKKKYGEDDPALVEMMEIIAQQNEELHNTISSLKGKEQPQMSESDKKIWDTITGFFNDPNIAVYEPFYGKSDKDGQWGRTLTGEQHQNRMKVLEKADQIVAGAKLQGKDMKYEDALLQAHFVVSDKVRGNVARQDLIQKIKARNNGLTVKSAGTKTIEPPDEVKSVEKAEKTAAKGLKKLFGKN